MTWAGCLVALTIYCLLALPQSITCSTNNNIKDPCAKIHVKGFPGEEQGKNGKEYRLSIEKVLDRVSYKRKKSFKGFGDEYKKDTDISVEQFLWWERCDGSCNKDSCADPALHAGCWFIGPERNEAGKATIRQSG